MAPLDTKMICYQGKPRHFLFSFLTLVVVCEARYIEVCILHVVVKIGVGMMHMQLE